MDLLFVIGPPAVGKMTVGQEIADRTGLRLFHNHMMIEPVLHFFPYESPQFVRLVEEFRTRVFEEVAASDLPGLIFTYVWAFDHPADGKAVQAYAEPFARRGARIRYVELEASMDERLRRNEGESRLAEKPSKRNLEASRRHLLEVEDRFQLNSTTEFEGRSDYLRLNTTDLSAAEAAERVIAHFTLGSETRPC
jgi:hypothetical protein